MKCRETLLKAKGCVNILLPRLLFHVSPFSATLSVIRLLTFPLCTWLSPHSAEGARASGFLFSQSAPVSTDRLCHFFFHVLFDGGPE